MSELRSKKRLERKLKRTEAQTATVDAKSSGNEPKGNGNSTLDEKFAKLLAKNEDELLGFVAKINKLYQEKLKRPAPFVTFVICGMQSSGKSTIMERFMNAPLNIVQEGTGTRCPLDTTCIHDETRKVPVCELYGNGEFQSYF
jgi:ribosome biogenesis GTPase A